jgi:diguanylate cyclase (GGDEF)-like protein
MVMETGALISMLYWVLADRPHLPLMLALGTSIILLTPVVLLVPIERWAYDHRGALFFYAWTTASTMTIGLISVIDGGVESPLPWLLVLTVTFTALTYPPVGVLLMGGLMVLTYLGVVATSADPSASSQWPVTTATLVIFTVMTAWASGNHWDLSDQQTLLQGRLETLADTDGLTSLLNRRSFDARLSDEAAKTSADLPLSLCLLDLDGFKQVNDSAGHATGDTVLVLVARALMEVSRETDHVGRLGGDEFAVLLPGVDRAAAAAVGTRLQTAVALAGAPFGVTASIGIVTCQAPETSSDLLARADARMYEAKATGRNRVRQEI